MSKKRGLLKATGAVGIAGLAGCFGLPLLVSDEDDESDTSSEPQTGNSDEETAETSSQESDEQEPAEPQYDLVQKFEFEASNTFEVTPEINGDILFAPNTNRNLYAIDSKSGESIWSHEFNEAIGATPVARGDSVFTNKEADNNMYSFDIASGEINWSIDPDYGFNPGSPSLNGEYVFVRSDGVKAYNADNGQEEWNYDFDGTLYTSSVPKITENNVINTSEYGIFAVSQNDGSEEWMFEGAGEANPGTLATTQTDVVYADGSNKIYVIDSQSGDITHEISTSNTVYDLSLVDNILYYDDDGIKAFDLSELSEIWSVETSIDRLSNDTLSGYLFGIDYDEIVGIDISNGQKILTESIEAPYNIKPVVVGNCVVMGNSSNSLVGYQISSD
ncbi:outer membrane protein assembly factor BamB family protein [Halorubrum sp. FL23]|uniref:outer membrane protein assembly factor BamB family protein n=1 Tax=Halorubrum sp. FL23 TaxID=3458704 RepID=UPI004034BE78